MVISYVNPNLRKEKAAAAAAGATGAVAANGTGTGSLDTISEAEQVTASIEASDTGASATRTVEVEEVDPYHRTTQYNYANTQDEREDEGKPTTAYCEIAFKNEAFKSVNVRSSFDGCSGAEERVQMKVDDKLTRAFKFLLNNPIRFPIKTPPPQPVAATANGTATTTSGSSPSDKKQPSSSPTSAAPTTPAPQHKTTDSPTAYTGASTLRPNGAATSYAPPPLPEPIVIPLPSGVNTSQQHHYASYAHEKTSHHGASGYYFGSNNGAGTSGSGYYGATAAAGGAAAPDDAELSGLHITSSASTRTGTVTHYSFAALPEEGEPPAQPIEPAYD